MRVLHVCRSFSPLSQTFVYDYVTELKRQGIESPVLTARRVNEEERPHEPVHVVPSPSRWHPERLARRVVAEVQDRVPVSSYWVPHRKQIQPVVASVSPDVVHAHFGPQGCMVAPVASALGCPLVVTFYGFDVSELAREPTWRREYKRLWSTVSEVTVLSEEMKERVVELGCPHEMVEVIHLSRDLSNFTFSLPTAPVRQFLSVGRLTEKKGHFTALQALKKVREDGYDIHLDLVGEGPLRSKIEAFVQRHELAEAVRLHGAVSNRKVVSMMGKADAFLLCSETSPSGDKEGTPTVLIEAQAMGLPCVTTRHAGIPEMIPRGNHFLLAEEGVTGQVARCIEEVVSLETRELTDVSERGQKKIQNEFSLSSEVSKLTKLYSMVKKDGKVRL